MHYLPVDDNIFDWDPENMEQYWSQCKSYDQFPIPDIDSQDCDSAKSFNNAFYKKD